MRREIAANCRAWQRDGAGAAAQRLTAAAGQGQTRLPCSG
ncbi:hypothetical protein XCR_3807 [Xanthomonas campestris pv. raphani 756C]|nr:hypothetical protein XCR_3807 [Xanthomonas campestris pv. raphani 756C]